MLSAILLRHSSGVLTCCEMRLPISESDDRAELSDCVVRMTVSASGVTGSMARHEETATEPLIKTRNSSWKQVASLTHIVCILTVPEIDLNKCEHFLNANLDRSQNSIQNQMSHFFITSRVGSIILRPNAFIRVKKILRVFHTLTNVMYLRKNKDDAMWYVFFYLNATNVYIYICLYKLAKIWEAAARSAQ